MRGQLLEDLALGRELSPSAHQANEDEFPVGPVDTSRFAEKVDNVYKKPSEYEVIPVVEEIPYKFR